MPSAEQGDACSERLHAHRLSRAHILPTIPTQVAQAPAQRSAGTPSTSAPREPRPTVASESASGLGADDVALSTAAAAAARSLFAEVLSDSPGSDDLEWLRQLPSLLSRLSQSLGHRGIPQARGLDAPGIILRQWLSSPDRDLDVPLSLHIFRQARRCAPSVVVARSS